MRPDLEAIRAHYLGGAYVDIGDPRVIRKLLEYIDELKAEVASLGDMLDNAHAREDANWFEVNRLKDRIAKLDERALTAEERLEQRTRERDEARDQAATLLDLYKKQCADDAKQMREYGLTYDGIRNLVAEYEREELSIGKIVELLRAAARELAKKEVEVLQARLAELERVRP